MKNKDVSIQMIRILSMTSIILCHLVQELNNSTIAKTGQFFNVGVYIFLFLSGWLYGQKSIQNAFSWMLGRVKKVLVPMWIFMLFLFGIHAYQETMKLKYIPIYLSNTQYWLGKIGGGAHLWFISVIFLCYLVTPFLQKIKKRLIIVILILIAVGDGLCYLSHVGGMTILYTSVYIIGYYFRNKEKEITEVNAVAIIILSLIIRLVSMKYLDGTVIYDCLLVYLTHTALAIGLFSLSRKIFDLKSRSSIDWFDDISYFVYITHYMFMVGPLRTMGLTSNLLLNTIITVTLSFFSATLLQRIYRTVIMENIK